MSAIEWQRYCLNDAQILSRQHRFSFHEPRTATTEALEQAEIILKNTPLTRPRFSVFT